MMKILGAGLSGLTAAIKLAEAGKRVQVTEQSPTASRFSESIQAIRNYGTDAEFEDKLKTLGLKVGKLFGVRRIIKYSPSMKTRVIHSKKPIFYTWKRGHETESVETALHAQAESLGVEFRFNARHSTREYDVIATGPLFTNGAGYHAHYKDLKMPLKDILFFLNNDFAPQGYACVIPYRESEATVLVTTFDETKFRHVGALFQKVLRNPVVAQIVEGAVRTQAKACYGFYTVPETAFVNKKYFVGEAAGFVEAARGFGIKYALLSGALAAQAIVEKTSYDALWKKAFERELIDSFKRRLALQRMSNADYDYLLNGEKEEISIEEYEAQKRERSTHFVKSFLIEKYAAHKLNEWRKKYDISKLV
ncbi:MAG: NAD(P)/FAD-dependent oxidoreductase [Candidatus Norongarragalinales archaeon]